MKINLSEKQKEFIEKVVSEQEEKQKFYDDFLKFLNQEKSNYTKLILQENLISYEITGLLVAIESIVDLDCIYKNTALLKTKIWIRVPYKDLQKRTLGNLVGFLEYFLNDKPLMKKLGEFVDLRNKITHKIFSSEYKKIDDLHIDSKNAVETGEDVLRELENASNGIFSFIKAQKK